MGSSYTSGATSIGLNLTEASRASGAYDGAKITLLGETRTILDTRNAGDVFIVLNGSDALETDAGDNILTEDGGRLLDELSGGIAPTLI